MHASIAESQGNEYEYIAKQLDNFIKTNPDKKITRSMKVLHMATQSLIGADK